MSTYLAKTAQLNLQGRRAYLSLNLEDTWNFCFEGVQGIFDIPDDAQDVKFVAYSRPGVNRIKLRWSEPEQKMYVDGEDFAFWSRTETKIVRLMKRFKTDTFYVECEYE